jgi:hypothetical protein
VWFIRTWVRFAHLSHSSFESVLLLLLLLLLRSFSFECVAAPILIPASRFILTSSSSLPLPKQHAGSSHRNGAEIGRSFASDII